jgi:hypothetical protein
MKQTLEAKLQAVTDAIAQEIASCCGSAPIPTWCPQCRKGSHLLTEIQGYRRAINPNLRPAGRAA